MRGAAFLTGASDALVVDVGGTSTDVGVLVTASRASRPPRSRSAACARTSACPTSSRSRSAAARSSRDAEPVSRVGPESVGYELREQALVFGGDTRHADRRRRGRGRPELGDPPPAAARRASWPALRRADEMLADAVDRVKIARGEAPLVVVGGGCLLVPDRVPGVSEVLRPPHHDVANAIGAAIAGSAARSTGSPARAGRAAAMLDAGTPGRPRRGSARRRRPRPRRDRRAGRGPAGLPDQPSARIRVKAAGPLPGSERRKHHA